MPTNAQVEEIAKKFGIESIPESVKRLNELISKRDACTEDIAKLINQDAELTARLLCAANPRADGPEDYAITSVEDALQRTGMSAALLLAMSDPLLRAVAKSFRTMLQIELKSLPVKELDPFKKEHVLGEVSFSGKARGRVHLRLPATFIPALGARLLGLSPADMEDTATANDVVGEVCNMIVGNFKSNLCDAGMNCKLATPRISRTVDFKLTVIEGGTAQRYGFRAKELDLFADLSVNPWNED